MSTEALVEGKHPQDFVVSRDDETNEVCVSHRRWSLVGLGRTLEEAAADLEDDAKGIYGVYHGKPDLSDEAKAMVKWIEDFFGLQSEMYINCVYCGHRYGPGETTPVNMADALKVHIEQCLEHPSARLRAEVERYREALEEIVAGGDAEYGSDPDYRLRVEMTTIARRALTTEETRG